MKVMLSLVAASFVALMLVAAALVYVFAIGNHRVVAVLLFACGALAVLAASYVASGLAIARNRIGVVPGSPAGPRPLTIALSGMALCALGMFFLLEV